MPLTTRKWFVLLVGLIKAESAFDKTTLQRLGVNLISNEEEWKTLHLFVTYDKILSYYDNRVCLNCLDLVTLY